MHKIQIRSHLFEQDLTLPFYQILIKFPPSPFIRASPFINFEKLSTLPSYQSLPVYQEGKSINFKKFIKSKRQKPFFFSWLRNKTMENLRKNKKQNYFAFYFVSHQKYCVYHKTLITNASASKASKGFLALMIFTKLCMKQGPMKYITRMLSDSENSNVY